MALQAVKFKNDFTHQQTRAFCRSGEKECCVQTRRHSTKTGISILCDILQSTVFNACVGQLCALNMPADIGLYRKHVLVETLLHNKLKTSVKARFTVNVSL